MTHRPRLAVIGAGSIGRQHARLVAADPDCELAAIVDPIPDARALADELRASWYPDHQAMLAHDVPDGAIVAVPNAAHGEVGLACAAAGVHLLIEKPVADTVAAGVALVEAAEAAGVWMLVGHHRRFDPAVEAARAIVQSGNLGRLVIVTVVWAAHKPDDYWQVSWRSAAGGGPVLINLIHDVDSLRHICGEIVEVEAITSAAVRGFEVEDTAAILLRFASGALGTVAMSDAAVSPWNWEAGTNDNPAVAWSGQNSYRLIGTTGSLEFPNLVMWRHEGAIRGDWGLPLTATPRGLGPRAAHAAQLRHFCAVIRGDERPRTDGRDGLATLAATMAVHESAASRRPVVPADVSPSRIGTAS
jgi:predicted dehydrogenase